MTPEEFRNSMIVIYDSHQADKERMHIEMDNLLCKLLVEVGYEEGIAVFKDCAKWYA